MVQAVLVISLQEIGNMLKRLEKELGIVTNELQKFLKEKHSLKKEIIDTKDFSNNICTVLTYFSKDSNDFIKSIKEEFSNKAIEEFRSIIFDKSNKQKFIQLCVNFLSAQMALEHYKYFLQNKKNIETIKGDIADIGAGFTCSSSSLFAEALKNKRTKLYLIEKYDIPIKVEGKIINLLKLKNVKILLNDVKRIPVKSNFFKEIHLNWSLHEFSPRFYRKEELFKVNKNKLTKKEIELMKMDYILVLKEIKRILSKSGKLVIKDHVLNKYYFCMIWDVVNKLFNSPEFDFTINYSK